MKLRILFIFSFVLTYTSLSAQTANDDIEYRAEIFPDSTIHSLTNGNTVQWNCVDEKLTGKCIKYHNDQWFYFKAMDAAVQYINVMGQQCRDLWGVQVVVIEGIPCQTETYSIITCVSLASQDDIFIPLKNLKPNAEYLINIDGYLHDYCSFSMEVSLQPRGLPVEQEIQVNSHNYVKNDSVLYNWSTPDSLQNKIDGYTIYRRKAKEFKFTPVQTFSTKSDAYGDLIKEFRFSELLGEGAPWRYKLIAAFGEEIFVMDQFTAYPNWNSMLRYRKLIKITLNFPEASPVSVELIDYLTGAKLDAQYFDYVPDSNTIVTFDITEWLKNGVERFDIRATNIDTGELRKYEYSKDGGLEETN